MPQMTSICCSIKAMWSPAVDAMRTSLAELEQLISQAEGG